MLLPNRQATPFPVTAQTQLYELHHCDDAFRIHGHRRAALDVAPSAEAGELTMKGEINRRIFMARRPEIVAALYEEASVQ